MQIELPKLLDYDYYSTRLLYIQAGEGLIRFNYKSRFVQTRINEEWEKCKKEGKPVLFIILKARRHGVSTYVQSRMFHECHLKSHRQGITISADEEGARYIHGMSHTFYEYLPEQLKPITKYKSGKRLTFDIPKTTSVKLGERIKGLKSSMKVVPSHEKAGLGTGNHYIHFSEYSNYRDAESVRKAVIPTAFNVPDMFAIIESTANGMAGRGEHFFEEWKKAKAGKSVFKPLFYSWLDHEDYRMPFATTRDKDELIETLDGEEKDLIEFRNASYEQLNWRRYQIRFLGGTLAEQGVVKSDIESFHEQYPSTDMEAFIVSGNPIFDRTALRNIREACKDPVWIGDVDGDRFIYNSYGPLKVWEWPQPGCQYVLSIDTASGQPGAEDYCCIELLRVADITREGVFCVQVAEHHERTEPTIIARKAAVLGTRYNNATIAPEVCGYGNAALSELQQLDYWNILKRPAVDDPDKQFRNRLGWKTDVSTKRQLTSFGRYCVNNLYVKIRSESLVDEMMIFVRDEDDKVAAYGKGNDDRVMAFLIAVMAVRMMFYLDGMGVPIGVQEPKKDDMVKIANPIEYDDFWDRKLRQGGKHWQDL